jgi:hypothetical protein
MTLNAFAECHRKVYYAARHFAECRYAECYYTECRGAIAAVNSYS